MSQQIHAEVRTVLAETNPVVRTGIQSALYSRGIRDVVACRDLASLVEALNGEVVDLLIWDLDLPGADLCWVVQQIRQNMLGRNPFVAVIATVADTSLDTVRRLINAGVDGVLGKPMRMNMVIDQIGQILESRRPFVATETYVGPSRRAKRRLDDSGDQLIRAPNTLRSKLLERADGRHVEHLIGEGMHRIRTLQAQSAPLALSRAIERIVAFHQGGTAADDAAAAGRALRCDLDRTIRLSNDMMRRHQGGSSEHLAELANSVLNLALRIEADLEAPNRVHLTLLGKLGQVLRRVAKIEEDSVEVVQEIAQTIGQFTQAWVGVT